MRSFFRDLFNSAINDEGVVKVVGGYDPIKDEKGSTSLIKLR